MISIQFVFWVLVAFFAVMGSMRGWQKEVIALTSMVAAMAILSNFGYEIMTRLAEVLPDGFLGANNAQQQVWLQIIFYGLFAFFGYQVVGTVAGSRIGGRFGDRLRATMERRIIGAILGAVNGFMLVGGVWGFLEYQITPDGYTQLAPGTNYVFSTDLITRPVFDPNAFNITLYLPQGVFTPTTWLILFFIAFFFVLIALI